MILSAKVAKVLIGSSEVIVDGLMIEDGTFAIGVPQIAMLFPYFKTNKNYAAMYLKRLMGADFKTHNCKTEFNRKNTTYIDLDQFEAVILRLYKESDPVATPLINAIVGGRLYKYWSTGFGQQFTDEQEADRNKARMKGKIARRGLTDAIKDWYDRGGISSRPYSLMFAHTTDAIYHSLWGMTALQLEKHLECDRHKLRDSLQESDLGHLEWAEKAVMYVIDGDDVKPVDAVAIANIRKRKTLPVKQSAIA